MEDDIIAESLELLLRRCGDLFDEHEQEIVIEEWIMSDDC
jgi:hypothetical protein